MSKEIKITKCGIFVKEYMMINIECSEEGMNEDGSLHYIENVQRAVNIKPLLIWNNKKYNESLRNEAQA